MAFKKNDYAILLENEPHGAFNSYKGDILKITRIASWGRLSITARNISRPNDVDWSYSEYHLHFLGKSKHTPKLVKALYGIKNRY